MEQASLAVVSLDRVECLREPGYFAKSSIAANIVNTPSYTSPEGPTVDIFYIDYLSLTYNLPRMEFCEGSLPSKFPY